MPTTTPLSFRGTKRRGICISFFAALLIFAALASARTRKKLPAHPFDLNTATLKQLEELPGVGPVTAHEILNFREKSGPFKSVNDLLVIPRISKKRLDKIRPYVFVKPPAKSSGSPAKAPAPAARKTHSPPNADGFLHHGREPQATHLNT